MNNGKIDTTSRLRGKRNTYSVLSSGGEHMRNAKNIAFVKLYSLFTEIFNKTDLRSGTIEGLCTDVIPFCEYLTERCGITGIAAVSRRHVEAYVAAVRTDFEAGSRRTRDVFNANMKLTALSLLCLHLKQAGAVTEDYGRSIPLIPYPDREDV